MQRTSRLRFCALFLSAVAAWHGAQAQDESVFTADLPFDAAQPIPSWMHGPPVSATGNGARVAFQLSPPQGRDLLLQLVFDETDGTGLRVEWLRDGSIIPEVIAQDLGEGISAPNQRPLLISASNLGGNGTLLLQGGSRLNVNRVRFEWVSERTILASASRYVPVVVTASRLTLAEADVDGGPRPAPQDEWRGRVVRAALSEKAELITPSITFVPTLELTPLQARFEASLAGVYLDQEVWLIVNDQEVGPLAIDVPTLEDPGHLGLPGREAQFAGWRKASIYISAALFLPGENSVVLELRSPVNSGYSNRAYVRDAILELCYPPPRREPNLNLPLQDIPGTSGEAADEALPAISTTPAPAEEAADGLSSGSGTL